MHNHTSLEKALDASMLPSDEAAPGLPTDVCPPAPSNPVDPSPDRPTDTLPGDPSFAEHTLTPDDGRSSSEADPPSDDGVEVLLLPHYSRGLTPGFERYVVRLPGAGERTILPQLLIIDGRHYVQVINVPNRYLEVIPRVVVDGRPYLELTDMTSSLVASMRVMANDVTAVAWLEYDGEHVWITDGLERLKFGKHNRLPGVLQWTVYPTFALTTLYNILDKLIEDER